MARRSKVAMKYHGFYCSDELWQTMQRLATDIDESDSEFIRNAIHERIQNKPRWEQIRNGKSGPYPEAEISKVINTDYDPQIPIDRAGIKPTIPELKQKVKEMEKPSDSIKFADTPTGKSKMVQSFMKGGK